MFEPEVERVRQETPPGMAHWAASGPIGTACMDCQYLDLKEGSKVEAAICLKYTKLMGRAGKKIPKWTAACKYFGAR